MKNTPKVSIIVPVYNAEKYLHRCVDSILAQTFTDWELLLIDDGSPDRSGEICDGYAMKDARIRVIHKENGGVSSARNVGLDATKGKWVVFVDSDDWCESNYLADFFSLDFKPYDNDIVLQGRKNEVDGKIVENFVLRDNVYKNIALAMLDNNLLTFGAPYCKLYSNGLIKKYDIRFPEEYSYGEDTTFFFRVLSVVSTIITTSKCNYHYVDMVSESLSKKNHEYEQLKMYLLDSMNLVKEIDAKSQIDNRLIKSYKRSYINLILRAVANMYRLKYSYVKKKKCFNDIKSNLLPLAEPTKNIAFKVMRYVPTPILVASFSIIVNLRK